MNNKHTHGPWSATQAYDHSSYTIHSGHDIRMPGSGGATVFSQGCSAEETEANAKLIAAAPELLEALQELVRVIHRDNLHTNQGVKTAAAMAAIAKATE